MARKKKAIPFAGKETPAEEAAEHKILVSKVRKAKREVRRGRRGK
jgi:hypothetical protein